MPVLRSGQQEELNLRANQTISVTVAMTGSGQVVQLSDVPGGGNAKAWTPLPAMTNTVIGPFVQPTRHRIICDVGNLSYLESITHVDVKSPFMIAELLAHSANR